MTKNESFHTFKEYVKSCLLSVHPVVFGEKLRTSVKNFCKITFFAKKFLKGKNAR